MNALMAPIVLFVYNRPLHTKQTIRALQDNDCACHSDLIIFSDAEKDDEAILAVKEVRSYIKKVVGFKSVKIIERKRNLGLADSIIDGVTSVVNEYGKIIVMEDDIVTSPAYLSFMNSMLNQYQENDKIWHISGWNYPINMTRNGDIFFWRVMNCWGWATWSDCWRKFDKDAGRLIKDWSPQQKQHFDLGGTGVFWPQVEANARLKINTWAIFWYATIYENNGLCINPCQSYVNNIGHDGSGKHCGENKELQDNHNNLCQIKNYTVQHNVLESKDCVDNIVNYYNSQKKLLLVRIINKLTRWLFKRSFF